MRAFPATALFAATTSFFAGRALALPAEHGRVDPGAAATPVSLSRPDGAEIARANSVGALTAPPAGKYVLRAEVHAAEGAWLEVPECIARGEIAVDGEKYAPPHGPFVLKLAAAAGSHRVQVSVDVTSYEARVVCSGELRAGSLVVTREGFSTLDFTSPEAQGGHAVLYVPKAHDLRAPGALLVGLHPWNGSMWTYAAVRELIDAADARDVPLLFPSGLGNSLYTAHAELEVLRALDAAKATLPVDPSRVSVFGASMGGAGATTIGFHHPDLFASISSFFGDSKFDLSTYVRSLLPSEAAAHAVNALDVAENVRHVPVWLIHGEADSVSPIAQSEMLARDLGARGYAVRFDRVPGLGHSGTIVAQFAERVVTAAASARAPLHPSRVSYRAARAEDAGAYGVTIERKNQGEAMVDVEYTEASGLVLRAAVNVKALVLRAGALGAPRGAGLVDLTKSGATVRWE